MKVLSHRGISRREFLVLATTVGVGGAALWTNMAHAASNPVLVGTGDIADGVSTADTATAKLLDKIPGTVFTTGNNAYGKGSSGQFAKHYHPTWGRHKRRTLPCPGNHDYYTPGASGYYGYFRAAAGNPQKGYYSYDRGNWHIVVLNTNFDSIDGGSTSPQIKWLKANLAANADKAGLLAYMHHPLISSGEHGDNLKVKPLWGALYAAKADVVLCGHDHSYERFAPQRPDGKADSSRGIRQFVVGTGGRKLRPFIKTKPNSQVRNAKTHGVLKLTLHPDGYDWRFVPVAGKRFTDSGSAKYH